MNKLNESSASRFLYWINERQNIYVNRFVKKLPREDWTSDPILREYKFTNVYRRLDRVSLHLAEWIREWLFLDPRIVLFNIILYRAFNWPQTLENLGPTDNFPAHRARMKKELQRMMNEGEQVFTGAYIITAGGRVGPKWCFVLDNLTQIWKWIFSREFPEAMFSSDGFYLEAVVKALNTQPGLGLFTSYEIACDLYEACRWNAMDINSWANPGPGALRGLNRLHYGDQGPKPEQLKQRRKSYECVSLMADLWEDFYPYKLAISHTNYRQHFHLREIEHSLCEFDKYERVRLGQGRPRSKFHPITE